VRNVHGIYGCVLDDLAIRLEKNGGEMKQSRLLVLLAVVAFAAIVIAPTVASAALLTNEWGQQFAGRDVCVGCHAASTYDATTHGRFAKTGASITPTSGQPGMWPVGLLPVGDQHPISDIAFQLGDGAGPTEWLFWNPTLAAVKKTSGSTLVADPATGPFAIIEGLEWAPENPSVWEYSDPVNGLWNANYTCSQCHQLGVVRKGTMPNVAANTNHTTGTVDAWSKFSADATTTLASWIPGSSIQCERCHGTGMTTGAHFTTGVGIVGFDSPTATSKKVLDSQVCGQCHASFKSGNVYGFTPDTTISAYVTQYTQADVPTVASFTANPAAYKFFPNGQNKGLKHVYYTEWAMSAHSIRGALTSSSPNATPYQKLGTSHFSSAGSITCNRCHTGEGYLKRKGATIMASFVETTTAEGMLGQECAVCHISHGAGTSTGMAVRSPELAGGSYSTAGLSVDNKSICEDCHNWQAEVLGTPVVPASTGRGPSHPQREVFHGRGFFEVAQSPDFMPGAKCEFCHMPATRTDFPGDTLDDRYGNRDFKRFSHRMFIMKPGDAQSWGLDVGQDSCTQCHAGSTRADLQASLNSWQSQAAGLDATLLTEITAAKARAEATSTAAYLVSVAYTNEKMFVNDSSGGAHNPPHIQNALTRSIALAKSVGGSFAAVQGPGVTVAPGTLSAIAGRIVNGDGSGAANGNLTLLASGVPVGTTASDANGNFAFTVAPASTTIYVVRWDRSSNATTFLNGTATVTVGSALVPTTITIARSTSSVLLNRQFRLSGVVTPFATVGVNMHVDVKKPGSPRYSYSSARTIYSSGGQALWLYPYTPRLIRGTYLFKAVFDANATFAGSTSSIVSVLVR
jgi:hypothetical protein